MLGQQVRLIPANKADIFVMAGWSHDAPFPTERYSRAHVRIGDGLDSIEAELTLGDAEYLQARLALVVDILRKDAQAGG